MTERKEITIFYLKDSKATSIVLHPNSFFLNENKGRDSINKEVADKLEIHLEESLDLVCDYYEELLQEAEQVIFSKHKFLFLDKKRTWLFSKVFNLDIESSFSRVRMIAYLDFLKKIKPLIDYEVKTDCSLFACLLMENGVSVNYIGRRCRLSTIFYKVITLNLILAKSFKKNVSKKQIGILSLSSNWTRDKGDRHLGTLKGIDQDFSYLHYITSRNHSNKFGPEDVILNSFLTIFDIAKVFFIAIFFYIRIFLGKSAPVKYKDMNLSSWLKQSLLEMCIEDFPSGYFYAISLRNYYKINHGQRRILITYGELFPLNQYMYSSLRELVNVPVVTAVQHAVNFQRKIVNHNKFVYSSTELPDYYLIHGPKYETELKRAHFSLKSQVIGCMKYNQIVFQDLRSGDIPKAKVLIAPSLNDFESILESIKNIDPQFASQYEFVLSPHPASDLESLEKELIKLPFRVEVAKNISSLELAKVCDIVIFSYSSVGLEALFFNKKIIRVYSRKLPKLFDDDLRIPTACDSAQLMRAFTDSKVYSAQEILHDYFGFSDGRAYERFSKAMNQISREVSKAIS